MAIAGAGAVANAATGSAVAAQVPGEASSPKHAAPRHRPSRTVSLEEHYSIAEIAARISDEVKRRRGFPPASPTTPSLNQRMQQPLTDLGPDRIADLDASDISTQVLSWIGPGADLLDGKAAIDFARDANRGLATAIAQYPSRYAGFAHLPMAQPEAAADELERCVREDGFVGALINGSTNGRFLDHPTYGVLLQRAEHLDVPLYLHPNIPERAVFDSYYGGLPEPLGFILATYGFGWHAEVAVHVLRMIFSGALERHRRLKLVIGHMGEFLPMAMARTTFFSREATAKIMSRDVTQQLRDQVWVTTSGLFTRPPLDVLIATFGIDRVMFSVDYPFSSNAEGRAFLNSLDLSAVDMDKLCFGNADSLMRLGRNSG
jgi:predicted TIM-barrel fold metal-dependent hydrolase